MKRHRPIWWHLWQFFGAIYMNYIMISSKRSMMNVIDFQSFWSVIRTFHICFSKTTNASIQYQSIQSNHSHTLLRTAWYPNSSSSKFTPHKENVTKKRHQKPPPKPFFLFANWIFQIIFRNYFFQFNFWKYFLFKLVKIFWSNKMSKIRQMMIFRQIRNLKQPPNSVIIL